MLSSASRLQKRHRKIQTIHLFSLIHWGFLKFHSWEIYF
ncbi:hypothetical protein LEP1GSC161_0128 [Leptospira santarosai str. CBC1416]|uniref:Uncharacterized protein n=1 Tax=Leptospira santarosai str. CBC1416 TaxID=1193059 RepID=M6WE65_9LEPT|nr:hypothetical protein LEP1GSC161_0128 [Leptospira santarosai str. CBC1416]